MRHKVDHDDFWTLLQQHNFVVLIPIIIILLGSSYAFLSKVDLMRQELTILEKNQDITQNQIYDTTRRISQLEAQVAISQSVRGASTLSITPQPVKK